MSDVFKICIVRTNAKECDYGDCGGLTKYIDDVTPWTEVTYEDYQLLKQNIHLLNKDDEKYLVLMLPPNQESIIKLTIDNAKTRILKEKARKEKAEKEWKLKNKKRLEAQQKKKELKELLKKAMTADINKLKEICGVTNE